MAKKETEQLTTRHSEETFFATDPKDMLNMYIDSTLYRSYKEDFLDEDTGEVVFIDRNEIIAHRGERIVDDLLATISFYLTTKDIDGVHISNQKRAAYELDSNFMNAWVAKALIDEKGSKYIFYSNSMANAIAIAKDYIEQQREGSYRIVECKEFTRSIILEDKLEEIEPTQTEGKKFIQIDAMIAFDGGEESAITFVVHTHSTEKALLVIERYIKDCERQDIKKGLAGIERDFKISIEKAAPIPIGYYIPKEFSEAYCVNNDK